MTGNFDVARVGGAVPYVYALAGFGAAGVLAALSQAWGRVGRALALALLAVGGRWAGVWCTQPPGRAVDQSRASAARIATTSPT